jgi:hypothetical protein
MPGNPYPHKYKYGKQKEPIDFDAFQEMMENGNFKKGDYHRSFLAFLYWFGTRRMGALDRKREDFHVENGVLFVKVEPLKRGEPSSPLEIDVDIPYVDLIAKQVIKTARGDRVWQFSETTAWRIVKRVDEKKYPHFFRLNRCTRMLDDPEATIPEIKAWFRWKTTKTIDSYIGLSRRHVRAGRERLRKELETD